MSLFERIFVKGKRNDANNNAEETVAQDIDYMEIENNSHIRSDAARWAILDTGVGNSDHRIHDIVALRYDGPFFTRTTAMRWNNSSTTGMSPIFADTTSYTLTQNTCIIRLRKNVN